MQKSENLLELYMTRKLENRFFSLKNSLILDETDMMIKDWGISDGD